MSFKLSNFFTGFLFSVLMFFSTGSPALANIPHENPDIATIEYSGVSLLRYYSETLDFILMKSPEQVEGNLEKMPHTYVQELLEGPITAFTNSSIEITRLIAEIDTDIPNLAALVTQSRLTEAIELAGTISKAIDAAFAELELMAQAVEDTGTELKVPAAPEQSPLKLAYVEVLEKLERIDALIKMYREILELSLPWFSEIEELLKTEEITIEELMDEIILLDLLQTNITLEINPAVSFVGDTVFFEGRLTGNGQPLAEREIELLLNSESHAAVTTDSEGNYEGSVSVPYWYIPEISVQALYTPKGSDIGLYLASLSPVIPLEALFYQAELILSGPAQSYPGLDTTLTGRFNYGSNPPADERNTEIYFGEVLIKETRVPDQFSEIISLAPELLPGSYTITAYAGAQERYAPAEGSIILNVVRVTPAVDVNLPRFGLIPGNIELNGRIFSEIGPLSQATVRIELGNSSTEVLTSIDGTFDASLKTGMDFGLIGTEAIRITVSPMEPWHSPLVTSKKLLVISYVNWIILLILLVGVIVFLPRRMPHLFKATGRRKVSSGGVITETIPSYSNAMVAPGGLKKEDGTKGEPRKRILFWYTFAAKIVQLISKITGKPQKTLREFAGESGDRLGPAARYFYQLTLTVERLLYSRYIPTEIDAENSMALARKVQQETASPDSTQTAAGQSGE